MDPETLRTEALDRAALHQVLVDEQTRRPGLSGAELRQSLTRSGTAARMLGETGVAVADLVRALELADDAEPTLTLARMRLAEAYRVAGDLAAAAPLLAASAAAVDDLDDRAAATVHQHLGKFAFDAGDFAAAVGHFDRSHRLRLSVGDRELIASSELALRVARQRLESLAD